MKPEPMVIGVLDKGAVADDQTDCLPAFQAAVAELESRLDSDDCGGIVDVPAARRPYRLSGPVRIRRSGIVLRGAGPRASRLHGGIGRPVVIVGNHDALGRADARYNGTPAYDTPDLKKKAGLVLVDAHAAFPWQPLGMGPHADRFVGTDTLSQLAVEMYVGPAPGAKWTAGMCLLGSAADSQRGRPWSVWTGGGDPNSPKFDQVELCFRVAGQAEGDFHRVAAPVAGPGPWRIAWQLDLAAGVASVWVDRRLASFGPLPGGVSGATLAPHDGCTTFLIGRTGPAAGLWQPGTPMILHGLRVRADQPYRHAAPTEVSSANGSAPTDHERYFSAEWGAKLLGYLKLDANENDLVEVQGDGRDDCGHWIAGPKYRGDAFPVPIGCRIQGLGIRCSYGPGVLLSNVLDFALEDCRVWGASVAAGSIPCMASYPVRFERCSLSGSEASVALYSCDLAAVDVTASAGRVLAWACNTDATRTFFAFPDLRGPIRLAGGDYGGMHRWVDTTLDNEGDDLRPGAAALECEPVLGSPSTLAVEGFYAPRVGRDGTLFRLVGRDGGGYRPSRVTLRDVVCPDPAGVYVEAAPPWCGTAETRTVAAPEITSPDVSPVV